MKVENAGLWATCAMLMAGMIYGICHCVIMVRRTAVESGVVCDLGQVEQELWKYHRWPERLENLGLDDYVLNDHICGKPFLYFPDARRGTEDILLAQPEPFRVGLWPIAEMRRNVIVASSGGGHRILYGEDAIVLKKAGLRAPR